MLSQLSSSDFVGFLVSKKEKVLMSPKKEVLPPEMSQSTSTKHILGMMVDLT